MTDDNALDRLAAAAGIEDGWWDFFGKFRPVSADTKRAFLKAMGFAVANGEAIARSLTEFEERPWRRWLEPVTVWRLNEGLAQIALTIPDPREHEDLDWTVEEEIGAVHGGTLRPFPLPMTDQRIIDGGPRRRHIFTVPGPLPPGFHRFRLTSRDGQAHESVLIICPAHAWLPDQLEQGRRLWGLATQVYALRSEQCWGVGDYSDLATLCAAAGRLGAAMVGVNPLHALFSARPEHYSPYSPSSRLFVNVAYLDPEAVTDYAESTQARALAKARRPALDRLRQSELVDYPAAWAIKRPVLEACWTSFQTRHLALGTKRAQAFREFQTRGGRLAEHFATFEALQEHFLAGDPSLGYWRHWPAEYGRPDNPAVAQFAQRHRDRVEFFWYLQWQADLQLTAVQGSCRRVGMPVGLYRDLGVGIANDGAEAWARQDVLALGVTIGAPPDPLALKGQDWGLAPFNPVALYEAGFQPFLDVLEANMRHAGALRLDHAMSLQRLYWIPQGCSPEQGAYVRYPVRELFALTALMSRRSQCLVIGEDLGTVPEGFRERMQADKILAYRIQYFEHEKDGSFKKPQDFTAQAVVQVGTHDMPSLRGWWEGRDVAERRHLNQYPCPEMADEEESSRERDRGLLVRAFKAEGLLPESFPESGKLAASRHGQLADAAHAYIERTPSMLMLVQIEDVLGLSTQMNLPGTIDGHPNWRRRFPLPVDEIAGDKRLVGLARRLLEIRGCARKRVEL